MKLTVSLLAVLATLMSFGVCQSTPQVRHLESLTYPSLARTAKVEGIVKIRLHLDPVGKVASMDVLDGPHLLLEAVENSVRKWTVLAGTGDGTEISFEFRLIQRETSESCTELSFDLPDRAVVVSHLMRPICDDVVFTRSIENASEASGCAG